MNTAMVASYVETLLEGLTGNDKVVPDHDGDYPVRYGDALYYVKIVGTAERPVILIFSVALAGVESSSELLEAVNDINTRLRFCRCLWVGGQVLFETEHLGATITPSDFEQLVLSVAEASDHFAPRLADKFGGVLAFAESQGAQYADEPLPFPGNYL